MLSIKLLHNSQKPFAVKPQTIFAFLKHTGLTAYHLIPRYLYWYRDKRPETQSWLLDAFHSTAESRPYALTLIGLQLVHFCLLCLNCLWNLWTSMTLKCWIMIGNNKQLQWLVRGNQYFFFFFLINAQETGWSVLTCFWTKIFFHCSLLITSEIWISRPFFVSGSSLIHGVWHFDTDSFHTLLQFGFLYSKIFKILYDWF